MKKIIDENGRLFGKVSILDLFVLLIALVLAFAVYSRFFTKEATATAATNDTFTYQIFVTGVRQQTVDALRAGDTVYENDDNTLIGTITDVEVGEVSQEYALSDGSYVLASSENRYQVILTVEASGLVSGGRYYASRTYELGAGAPLTFYTKYCSTSGTVWSIGEA